MGWVAAIVLAVFVGVVILVVRRRVELPSDDLLDRTDLWKRMRERARRD